jgi:hypothetical protein
MAAMPASSYCFHFFHLMHRGIRSDIRSPHRVPSGHFCRSGTGCGGAWGAAGQCQARRVRRAGWDVRGWVLLRFDGGGELVQGDAEGIGDGADGAPARVGDGAFHAADGGDREVGVQREPFLAEALLVA